MIEDRCPTSCLRVRAMSAGLGPDGVITVTFVPDYAAAAKREEALHLPDLASRWASPPAKPMIDRAGAMMRDQRTGKIKYQGLVAFTTARIRNAWSDQIIRALRDRYPKALADAAPERAA